MLLGLYRVARCTQTMVTKQNRRAWKVEEQRKGDDMTASDEGVSAIMK